MMLPGNRPRFAPDPEVRIPIDTLGTDPKGRAGDIAKLFITVVARMSSLPDWHWR